MRHGCYTYHTTQRISLPAWGVRVMAPAFLGAALLFVGFVGVVRATGPGWVAGCIAAGIGSALLTWSAV